MDKIKQYFENKAISNSLLGALINPRWVKLKMDNPDSEDGDRSYFRIGAALDCLLTSPERWEQDFLVIDAVRPYGLLAKFIDNLPSGLTASSPIEHYQEAYDKSGYKMWLDKVVDKFWLNEEAVKYYSLVRDVKEGVSILSSDEYDNVVKAKELILANEFVRKYFINSDPTIEILHQVPIYFTYKDEQCKALLDGIYIDHLSKTIQPFDLKTTGFGVYEFRESSFLKFGYYRQCAFYELALLSEESPIKELLSKGYQLLDFIFIVVENKKSSSHPAVIYRTTTKDRKCGLDGGYVGRRYYKGVNQLIDELKFHRENNYWDLPMELIKTNGEIKLDVFNAEEHLFPASNV